MPDRGFAVLDVETTGFSPNRGDRIVEIAIVHVSPDGEVEGAWESLVDPQRDVGATRIHGIEASHVLGAPTFGQLGPRILNLLSGRVLVAHNLEFDARFLRAEVAAVDESLVLSSSGRLDFATICTMRLASEFFPASARSLDACCESAGITRTSKHRALDDARDTASLLAHYWAASSTDAYWGRMLDAAGRWTFDESGAADWYPRSVAVAPRLHFLERISLDAAPIHASGRELDYLGILDRALLDGHLSRTEEDELVAVARELGLPRTAVEHLHRSYVHRMVAAAWADGILTPVEHAELASLSAALGVTGVDFGEPTLPPIAAPPVSSTLAGGSFALTSGDVVVLTGDMTHDRSAWIAHLATLGIAVAASASKKVKLAVAADPDSQSGKARRARELQIPLVTEAKLIELVGGAPG
ncbi:MAG TPA: exonuclease domain-containing protein [Myxococcota bacterium]